MHRYRALERPQVNAGIRGTIAPARFAFMIVGDAKVGRPQLDGLGLPVEMISAATVAGPVALAVPPHVGTNWEGSIVADIDGNWNCTVKSPLGDQNLTMTITASGNTFSGQAGGAMGSMPIKGSVEGDVLKWKLSITVPMPMTLDCEATVSGDTMSGDVGAGGFGSFALTGTRA